MNWEPGHDPTREARIEELTEQVFAVMASLPPRDDNPRSETDIRRWANNIAHSTPWPEPFSNGMTRAKQSVVRDEIDNFKKAIEKAEQILLGFHNDTFEKALELGTDIWSIRASMQPLIDFAEKLSKAPLNDIPEENKKSGKGRESLRAESVANHCANYYYWITGKDPSRAFGQDSDVVSDFMLFLEQVFKIVEIAASADRVAKAAIRIFHSTRTNWTKKQSNPSI